jgi:UDP-glucose 6-dehydrogenase
MTISLEKPFSVLVGKLVTVCKDPYTAAQDAHAIIIMTEWDEFKGKKLISVVFVISN